jgi:hypothetical protein
MAPDKTKATKPWVPGTPEVGQQFGQGVITDAEREALESQMIPPSGNLCH